MKNEIKKLAFDVASGKMAEGYTKEAGEKAIREKINEVCGGEFNFYNFKQNQWSVFAILAEVLTVATNYLQNDAFDMLVEYKDVELGDQIVFEVENTDLYKVSQTAIGTNDIMRQRIVNKRVSATPFNLSVKIYEELKLFMAGRVDFSKMITKVSVSFNNHIAGLIATAMYASYSDLVAPYVATGSFNSEVLLNIVSEVEAATGMEVAILGTKKALAPLVSDLKDAPESVKEQVWNAGIIGKYMGVSCIALPQGKNAKGENIALDDTLIIIPISCKPVKFGWNSPAIVGEADNGMNNTLQQVEFMLQREACLAVIASQVYGMYRITK